MVRIGGAMQLLNIRVLKEEIVIPMSIGLFDILAKIGRRKQKD
jgi:hypothetical protein